MSNPRVGARCRLHYRKALAGLVPHHGRTGVVEIVGRGRPRNHGVRLDGCGTLVVVPCGNMVPAFGRPTHGRHKTMHLWHGMAVIEFAYGRCYQTYSMFADSEENATDHVNAESAKLYPGGTVVYVNVSRIDEEMVRRAGAAMGLKPPSR